MLVPWKEQESTERVFLLQQMKPAFPPSLMPRAAQPLFSLSPSQSFPPLFYTFCPFCDDSSLPLHLLSKASRHWGQLPWGTLAPSAWILQFRVAHQCSGLAPWCPLPALVSSDHIHSCDWAQKKSHLEHLTLTRHKAESVWWQSLKSSCISPIDKMWLVWMLMKFKCHECTVSFRNC